MRRAARGLLVIALLAAVPAGWFLARPDPDRAIRVRPSDIPELGGLAFAYQRYEARGARYVWGANDCSVFVSDYLRGRGTPIGARLTTACLAQPDLARRGLLSTKNPKPGDVLNYRYRSPKTQQWVGHCGVVVRRGRGLWVMHNALEHGLVVQPLSGFLRRAEEVGVPFGGVRILRPATS